MFENDQSKWKEHLDALKFISETHRSLHDQRRKAELQAFFACATLYALIGAAKFAGKLQVQSAYQEIFLVGAWLVLIIIAVVSILCLWGLHRANIVNQRFAEMAEDKICETFEIEKPKGTGSHPAMTLIWEAVMLVILGVAVGLSLSLF